MMQEPHIEEIMQVISAKLMQLRKQRGYSSHENFAMDNDIARMQENRKRQNKHYAQNTGKAIGYP